MSVDQQSGAGHETWVCGQGIFGVQLDEDKAVPGGAVPLRLGLELAEECFLELEDVGDPIGGNERGSGGGGRIGEQDVFEFVGTGRQDGGALVDFRGIEQVENGEALDGEDLVHAFDTESALAVEEVGDVGLLESGLLGKPKAGQFSTFNAFP